MEDPDRVLVPDEPPAGVVEEVDEVDAVEAVDGAVFAGLPSETAVLLDLRSEVRAYAIDAALGSSEHDRMRIVCPNGQQMGFREWLGSDPELARRVVEARSGWIGLSADQALAAEASDPPPACRPRCYRCTDGVWMCQGCAEARVDAPPTRAPRQVERHVFTPFDEPSRGSSGGVPAGSTPGEPSSGNGHPTPSGSPDPGAHPGR